MLNSRATFDYYAYFHCNAEILSLSQVPQEWLILYEHDKQIILNLPVYDDVSHLILRHLETYLVLRLTYGFTTFCIYSSPVQTEWLHQTDIRQHEDRKFRLRDTSVAIIIDIAGSELPAFYGFL